MSVYLVKGKGWRYDFTLNGTRHTETWFKTKTDAKTAEAKQREELARPKQPAETPTDISFFELVNLRLDHVKAFNSEKHYKVYRYLAKKWIKEWGEMECSRISNEMVVKYILGRAKGSGSAANHDLRCLRAAFNFGIRKKWISANPTSGIGFVPEDKRVKRIPRAEEVERVIAAATPEVRDYLYLIADTMARVSEINRLIWDDIYLEERYLVLYTRKKKGGNLTPRKVFMTNRIYEILSRRFRTRDKDKPWVFWHRWWNRKKGKFVHGPFQYRKKVMKTLCKKAGVQRFQFHPLRHCGASLMEENGVPISSIQRILGHESRKTTEIYLHSIGDMEKKAIEVYETATRNSHTVSHTDGQQKNEELDCVSNPSLFGHFLVGLE